MSAKPSFWLSKAGMRASTYIMSGLGAALVGAQIFPHSLLGYKYVELVQMYSEKKPVPVPDDLEALGNEVIKKMNPDEAIVKFFTPIGFDIFSIGNVKYRHGVNIAIPYNYRYKTIEEINSKDQLLKDSNYDVNSEVGRSLLSSLVLSERARKFAIAREFYGTTTSQIYVSTGLTLFSTFFTYSISRFANLSLNLYIAPRYTRLVVYTLSSLFGLTTYFLMKDGATAYYDKEADQKVCEFGEEYCRGGVEFYEKQLERNKCLREVLGDKGKASYTSYGNEEIRLRTKRMPITDRLETVKMKLKEYTNPQRS